jgi:hypothetical protein
MEGSIRRRFVLASFWAEDRKFEAVGAPAVALPKHV